MYEFSVLFLFFLICIILNYIFLKLIITNIKPSIEVRLSNVHGIGVFSNKYIKKGEIIEIVPLLSVLHQNIEKSILVDYVLTLHDKLIEDERKHCIMLGYGSIYNHSSQNNANWSFLDNKRLKIEAVKNILPNEEIFVNYGEKYWKNSRRISHLV